jgi:hypothetical protein
MTKVVKRINVKIVYVHFQLNGMIYQKIIKKKYVVHYVKFLQTIKFDISSFFFLFTEIPSDTQRCCMRCYDKVADQVRQRQTNPINEEEEDEDEDDTITINRNSKHDDGKRKSIEID